MKNYEIRITTNWNTGSYESFEISAEDIFDARNKAIDEAIAKGYTADELDGLNEPVELEPKEQTKTLTIKEKEIIANGHSLRIDQIPDSLEITTKEEWAIDIAGFWEIDFEEALEQLSRGEGYSSISLPMGGMVAIETNGDHLFFVSDMES